MFSHLDEERTKAKKKAEIEARKAAIRTEDIAKGIYPGKQFTAERATERS